jgi:hypothetical protein
MTNPPAAPHHFHDFQVQLAQDRFGLQVTARLSDASDNLPHDISERLRVARQQALTKRKVLAAPRTAPSVMASGGQASMTFDDENISLWGKVASALPVIALLIGLVVVSAIQDENRARELADVDAALLTDDLPPAAYTDPGFVQFLKSNPTLNSKQVQE